MFVAICRVGSVVLGLRILHVFGLWVLGLVEGWYEIGDFGLNTYTLDFGFGVERVVICIGICCFVDCFMIGCGLVILG